MRSAILLGAAMVACLGVGASALQSPERRVIRITAERFAFTPSEITVDVGDEVELRIKSDDTAHGFRIVGKGISLVIPKRGKGELAVTFQADEPGRHTFECTRMCGAGHHFMRGELVVRNRPDRTGVR